MRDPMLVLVAFRSWLVSQTFPDPEAGDADPAYARTLDKLDELISWWAPGVTRA